MCIITDPTSYSFSNSNVTPKFLNYHLSFDGLDERYNNSSEDGSSLPCQLYRVHPAANFFVPCYSGIWGGELRQPIRPR